MRRSRRLGGQIRRWSAYGHYVVPDTSFYIEHPAKLEVADFGPLIEVWESPITVLVPMVVVDELDRLKEIKDRHKRWRAGYTLAVLDRLFARWTGRARLQAGLDEPGPHGRTRGVRLPINDDELVDRALAIQPLAGRQVTLLTYDTGQASRARNAGLQVVKLRKEIGEEPAEGN
jgi:rRNA-processing protein FCF1